MANRKISDVLWLALQCAKDDRQSLVDAYSGDKSEPAVRQALADIRAFENLQKKLFGSTTSKLENMMSKMNQVSILKILADGVDDAEQGLHWTAGTVRLVELNPKS